MSDLDDLRADAAKLDELAVSVPKRIAALEGWSPPDDWPERVIFSRDDQWGAPPVEALLVWLPGIVPEIVRVASEIRQRWPGVGLRLHSTGDPEDSLPELVLTLGTVFGDDKAGADEFKSEWLGFERSTKRHDLRVAVYL